MKTLLIAIMATFVVGCSLSGESSGDGSSPDQKARELAAATVHSISRA
jgi:hypothetical protein